MSDLFLVIISIAGIFFFIFKNKWSDFNNLYSKLFILLYLIILISGILSENFYKALIDYDGPIFYFRYIFFIIFIQSILSSNQDVLYKFIISLNIVVFFTCLHGLFQWLVGTGLFERNFETTRITGVFGNEEVLGHFLGYIAPLLYILNIYKFKNKYFWPNSFLFLFCIFIIFISGDRTGFLKILFFLILLIVLTKKYQKYFIPLIITLITLFYFALTFSENLSNRVIQTIHDVSNLNIPYLPFSKTHEYHFISSYKMFKDKPILGYGPQGFRIYCAQNKEFNFIDNACNNHPHNYYFQSISELGFLGFILILIILISLSIKIFKLLYSYLILKITNNFYVVKILITCQFFINIFPIMAHFNFYNNWVNVLLFLNLSFLIYFNKKNEH